MPSITRTGAALLLAALAVASCAKPQNNAPPPSIVSEVGGSPSPTPSPAPPPKPSPKPSPSPKLTTPAPPAFPTSAELYAKAVVQAWVAKDLDKLAKYTTDEVHEQLIEIPGPINMKWTFKFCEGAAGSTYCRFANEPGDVLILRMSNALLGKPDAAVEVQLHPKA